MLSAALLLAAGLTITRLQAPIIPQGSAATPIEPRGFMPIVSPRDGDLTVSALYGYRLNWQTTFYLGYGDFMLMDQSARLLPNRRSVFMKAS